MSHEVAVVGLLHPTPPHSGTNRLTIMGCRHLSTMAQTGKCSAMSRQILVPKEMDSLMILMPCKTPSTVRYPIRLTDFQSLTQVPHAAGIDGISRNQNQLGTTGQPAVIYLPRGVYMLSKPIQLYVGTVILGDALSPPTIKAAPGFNGNTLVFGKDPHDDSTINFYIGLKNLVFDSNNINKDTQFTILDWSVSQATQLTNCVFNMPSFSSGHIGIHTPEGGSGTYLGDLEINGGNVGIKMDNQQYMIKGVKFQACTTAIKFVHCYDCIVQDCTFKDHAVAMDMTTGAIGSIVLLDSLAQDVGTMVLTTDSGNGDRSLILENVQNNGIGASQTVMTGDNRILLSGNVADTWVMGNTVCHYNCNFKILSNSFSTLVGAPLLDNTLLEQHLQLPVHQIFYKTASTLPCRLQRINNMLSTSSSTSSQSLASLSLVTVRTTILLILMQSFPPMQTAKLSFSHREYTSSQILSSFHQAHGSSAKPGLQFRPKVATFSTPPAPVQWSRSEMLVMSASPRSQTCFSR